MWSRPRLRTPKRQPFGRYGIWAAMVFAAVGAGIAHDCLAARGRPASRPAYHQRSQKLWNGGARHGAQRAARPQRRVRDPHRSANASATRTRSAASHRAAPGANRAGTRRPSARNAGTFHSGANRAAMARPAAGRHWPLPGEPGFTGVPPRGETRFVANEMVLQLGSDVSPQTVETIARRNRLSIVGTQDFSLGGKKLYRIRIGDDRAVADVIHDLEAENLPLVAQPNYRFILQQDLRSPAPARSTLSQYTVGTLRLTEAHRIATGNKVIVAVIDSEVDARHPDLSGSVAGRFEPVRGDDKPHSHGTGMAGAIASHRRLLGVAPRARLLAVHAFSPDARGGEATSERILMGLDWAIGKGARIINMSFAGPRDPLIQLALKTAQEKGVVVIAAAGNAGPKSPPLFPAADPNVIAVTATDINNGLFAQANRGSHVAVAAPGVDILEPAPDGRYQITTGTSVAAAHVSGVVALLLERKPGADPKTIRTMLTSTAKDLGAPGRDDDFGWGLVDPPRALQALDASFVSAR